MTSRFWYIMREHFSHIKIVKRLQINIGSVQAKIYDHYLAEIMVDFAYFVAEAIRNNVRSIDGGAGLWRFIFVLQIFLFTEPFALSEFGTISTS